MGVVEFFSNVDNVLSLFVAFFVFATFVSLISGAGGGPNLDRRIRVVLNQRSKLKAAARDNLHSKSRRSIRINVAGIYKKIVDLIGVEKLLEDPKMVQKLALAGFRGPRHIFMFYLSRIASPIISSAILIIVINYINDFHLADIQKICAYMFAFIIGFYVPTLFLNESAQRRQNSITIAFPDVLDLLLICVESGMAIDAAVTKVASEVGTTSIEMAEELTLLSAELSYLPERRIAYERLALRTNNPGVKSVSLALIQAERYGTPLALALRTMAKENRDLRLASAEKKAAALPAQLTVPLIVFFLPVLFGVMLGPTIIRVQDTMAVRH